MGVVETLAKKVLFLVLLFSLLVGLVQSANAQTYKEDLFPIWQSQIRTVAKQEAVISASYTLQLLDGVMISAPTVGGSSLANTPINIEFKKVNVPNVISKAINLPLSWELDFLGSWYQVKAHNEVTTHAGKTQKPALQISVPIPTDVQSDEFLAVLIHYPRNIIGNGALFLLDQGQRNGNNYIFAASGIYEKPYSFSLVRFRDASQGTKRTKRFRQTTSYTSHNPNSQVAFTAYCSVDSVLLHSCNPRQLSVAADAALERYTAYNSVGFAQPVVAQDIAVSTLYGKALSFKLMLNNQEADRFSYRPCPANTGAFDTVIGRSYSHNSLRVCDASSDAFIRAVVGHELFHAVQLAYLDIGYQVDNDNFVIEGTATAAMFSDSVAMRRQSVIDPSQAADVAVLGIDQALFRENTGFYEAQDFWVFLGESNHYFGNEGFAYLPRFFEFYARHFHGKTTHSVVNDFLIQETGYGLGSAYFNFAKNHFFERNVALGGSNRAVHDVLPGAHPCDFDYRNPKGTVLINRQQRVDYVWPSNFQQLNSLEPLSSMVYRFHVREGSNINNIMVQAQGNHADLRYKIYEQGSYVSDNCVLEPDNTPRNVSLDREKVVYVLMSNTNMEQEIRVNLLVGPDLALAGNR